MKRALPWLGGIAAIAAVIWLLQPGPEPATPEPAPGPVPSNRELLPPVAGHAAWVRAVAVAGDQLYSGDMEGFVVAWDLVSGRATRRWKAHDRGVVALHPVSGGVFTAGADGAVARWTAEGQPRGRARLPSRYLNDGAPLGSGAFVAADTGVVARLDEASRWQKRAHDPDALAAAVSPDSTRAASGGHDGWIRVWDPTDGAKIRTFEAHTGWVSALAWHRGTLYSAGYDGRLRGFTEGVRTLDVAAHERPILALAATETHVLTGADDFTARVFDPDGTLLHTLKGPELPVEAVALDEARAFTGTRDHKVRVWRLADGALEATLE